jgi:predicted site-specific integrase-resolvase
MRSVSHGKRRRELHGETYVTISGIAEYCMVSTTTVHRWVTQGILVAMALPSGHLRVSVPDFREFLKRNNMAVREELT